MDGWIDGWMNPFDQERFVQQKKTRKHIQKWMDGILN